MKKQLSLTLLTLSIFSLNILPAKAAIRVTSSNTEVNYLQNKPNRSASINGNKWCAEVPWMGFFCWAF